MVISRFVRRTPGNDFQIHRREQQFRTGHCHGHRCFQHQLTNSLRSRYRHLFEVPVMIVLVNVAFWLKRKYFTTAIPN